ncbi:MAG: DUF2169 domain-containing protein [Polyangiaceae bacterium]
MSTRPLRTASLVWQPKAGAWTFTVVAKLTYDLAPGECPLAAEQEDPHEDDGHWDDDPARSLRFASDLVPIKTAADITIIGSAYSPGALPQRSFVARFRVGEVERAIEVHADRAIGPDGSLIEGPPIARMPLLYERARGGPQSSNPVGIPPLARDAHGRTLLPNLQDPGAGVESIEPVGFGPVAPSWPGRRVRLGRNAEPALATLASKPMPWGFDLGFFCAAPPEQQVHALRDDERLFLYNLTFEHAHLSTRLPAVRPRAFVDRGGNVPQPLAMRPDTLAIDTDRNLCTLVFRGHFPLSHPGEAGRVLVAAEVGNDHLGWAEVVQAVSARLSQSRLSRSSMPSYSEVSAVREPSYPMLDEDSYSIAEEAASMTLSDQEAREVLTETLPFAKQPRPRTPSARESRPVSPGLPFVAPGAPAPAPAPPPPPPPPPPPSTVTLTGTASPLPGIASPLPATASPAAGPILRSLPGAESPWASGAPSQIDEARATIGTVVASQSAKAEPAALRDPSTRDAVLRASNAAAAKTTPEPLPETRETRETRDSRESRSGATGNMPAIGGPAAEAKSDAKAEAKIPTIDVFDLLWFERAAMPKVRKNPAWRALLRDLENRPADPDLDDATLGASVAEVEDRRDVFELLARASAESAAGIEESLSSAIRPDGKVVAPLVLAAGDLELPFDEVEVLRAHVAIISPLAAGDDKLKTELSLVRDFLASPELSCAPPMVEALSARLWEAFSKAKRAVPADTLKAHAASMLLQKRKFQRREVFGGNHLRAVLHAGAGGGPFPSYMPASLAPILPMFQRFRVRLFAEVHMTMDQHEACPTALRVVALARVVERARKPPPPTASPGETGSMPAVGKASG